MVHLIQRRTVGYMKSPEHRTPLLFYFLRLVIRKTEPTTFQTISIRFDLNHMSPRAQNVPRVAPFILPRHPSIPLGSRKGKRVECVGLARLTHRSLI